MEKTTNPSVLSLRSFRVDTTTGTGILFTTSSELGSRTELRMDFLFEDSDEYGFYIYSDKLHEDIPMIVDEVIEDGERQGWLFFPINDEYYNKFPHAVMIWNT